MHYLYFNPETDMALALGNKQYNEPKAITQFKNDLALLPVWYAEEGDCVLLPEGFDAEFVESVLSKKIGGLISVQVMHLSDYKKVTKPDDVLVPWGYNHTLKKWWQSIGKGQWTVDCDKIRELSGRNFTIDILENLRSKGFPFSDDFQNPIAAKSVDDVFQILKEREEAVLLKMPWSSSGKGLLKIGKDVVKENDLKWVQNVIDQQGFVMVEKWYDKVLDFALEFKSHDGVVEYFGSSIFETENGKYKGNLLYPESDFEKKLKKKGLEDAECVILKLKTILCEFFSTVIPPVYEGYFGVDMMLMKGKVGETEMVMVHPCVELNLRTNMGVLTRCFYDKYVEIGKTGMFYIKTFRTEYDLLDNMAYSCVNNPIKVRKGRVYKGVVAMGVFHHGATTVAYAEIK